MSRLGNILDDPRRVVGSFVAPHQDGDFQVTLIDLYNWATGYVMIRQVGQGQVHEQVYTRDEARELAGLLTKFADAG